MLRFDIISEQVFFFSTDRSTLLNLRWCSTLTYSAISKSETEKLHMSPSDCGLPSPLLMHSPSIKPPDHAAHHRSDAVHGCGNVRRILAHPRHLRDHAERCFCFPTHPPWAVFAPQPRLLLLHSGGLARSGTGVDGVHKHSEP